MRSTISTAAVVLSALSFASAQTFTACDPTKKTCPADPGLGGTVTYDFTKGANPDFTLADGTTMKYDPVLGATFAISKSTDAPTVGYSKYIMFGKVSVVMRAAPGAGIVSSFILESDDLDEIDWEWVGAVDTDAQTNFFGKGNTTTYDRGGHAATTAAVTSFHTYEIDWNKDAVKWSIDGNTVRTLTYNDPLTHGGTNYPQTPMKVKMGSWVGCADKAAASDPKTQGTCEWASGPADFSKAPFNMYVQSVTIQDYGCGGDYTYSDMTGSYQSIKSSGKCDGKANTAPVSSTASVPAVTGSASSTSSTASGSASGSASASRSATTSASGSSSAPTTAASNGTISAGSTGTGSNQTTLATATGGATGTGPKPTGTGSAASSTSSAASSSGASKPAHTYGYLDMGVIALGLTLGYFVM